MSKTIEVHEVEEIDVRWPDGEGRNSIVVITPLNGPTIEITLSTSATEELRSLLTQKQK